MIDPFQIAHGDVLADDEPLDLLEHRRVRQVQVVAPVHAARRDHAHRRPVRLHVADLHRRGVRPQQRGGPRPLAPHPPRSVRGVRSAPTGRTAARERLAQVQRVLHVARGVIRRHVERFEVVVVVLGLGAVEDLVPLSREDRLEALTQHRERVTMADDAGAAGKRHVDGPGRRPLTNRARCAEPQSSLRCRS